MDRTDYNNMTNTELKLCLETLENEFNAKKNEIEKLCDDLKEIQKKVRKVDNEISLRKNIF